jgi:hypothetical protein
MAYIVSEIGQFEIYTPDPWPEAFPSNAIFSRRASDGADWYAMAHKAGTFPATALVATALPGADPDLFLMQAIVRSGDAQMLFPGVSLVLQIDGVPADLDKPHRLFEQQVYRRSTGVISPLQARELHQLSKKVLWDRMTADEADRFDADLQEAPSKLRRTFDAATVLDDRDPLWPALREALLVRVSPERADALLQRTD